MDLKIGAISYSFSKNLSVRVWCSVFIQISCPLVISVNVQIASPCHLIFNSFMLASLPMNCTQGWAPHIFVADSESCFLFFVPPCELFRAAIRVTNDFRYASESQNISFDSSHFFSACPSPSYWCCFVIRQATKTGSQRFKYSKFITWTFKIKLRI